MRFVNGRSSGDCSFFAQFPDLIDWFWNEMTQWVRVWKPITELGLVQYIDVNPSTGFASGPGDDF